VHFSKLRRRFPTLRADVGKADKVPAQAARRHAGRRNHRLNQRLLGIGEFTRITKAITRRTAVFGLPHRALL
jgi:hypothetical protein